MTITKTTKTARDTAATPANFPLGLVDESGVGAGPFTPYHYVADGATGTLITPATDGVDGTGLAPPAGAVGIRGWLSGIYSKLAASIAVTGTFWQATQPMSAATLPLPVGAATSAKQPAFGSAATPSSDVITVQGAPGGTPIQVSSAGPSYAASGVAPITGTFAATGQSATFTPKAGPRNFYVGIDGTFSATIQLERKTANSSIWRPLTAGGIQIGVWTGAAEEAFEEHQTGAQYRLNCTVFTSGPANFVLEQ